MQLQSTQFADRIAYLGFAPSSRGNPMHKMPIELVDPDLVASLELGPFAPRAARHYVAQVDHPSPDLRDAVMLLTSELVTRAVRQCQSPSGEAVELRVWMPADVVRVELRAPRELLCSPLHADGPPYDLLLFGHVADRWSTDTAQHPARMWFEIDRHSAHVEPRAELPRRRTSSRWSLGSAGASGRP
jgi:hypothetical protein